MNLHKGVYFSLRMTREVLMEQLMDIYVRNKTQSELYVAAT